MVGAVAVDDMSTLHQWIKTAALLAPIIVGVVQALRKPKRKRPPSGRRISKLPVPLLLLLALGLSGCATGTVSSVIHELAGDTNKVHVTVQTPWGSVQADRN